MGIMILEQHEFLSGFLGLKKAELKLKAELNILQKKYTSFR